MRIGIDIDGVITDCERYSIDYGTKYCVENNLTYKINLGNYDISKALGISKENEKKFWNQYLKYYVTEGEPRNMAVEVINRLKEEGNEIYLITARNQWGLPNQDVGKMREFTETWLKKKKINYDKILYTEGSKIPYVIGNYIDIMIEDSPKNVKELSKKVPVLCYNTNYNENIKGKNITRVYTWCDIYRKLKEFNKDK